MRKLLIAFLLLGAAAMAGEKSVYDFTMNSIEGEPTSLQVHGKVVPLVNVASRCGFTPQYAALEKVMWRTQGPRAGDCGIPAEQLWRAGTWFKSGDQDVLLHEIQCHLPDDGQSFRERRGTRLRCINF
jgi:hypothetical protein